MSATPLSFLERLKHSPDEGLWRQFVDLYAPLIGRWLRSCGVRDGDADDLTQKVLMAVVRDLPDFQHRGPKSFRGWLRAILRNRVLELWRNEGHGVVAIGGESAAEILRAVEDPDDTLGRLLDEEHDSYVLARLLERVRPEFDARSWEAFHCHSVLGEKATAVASRLGGSAAWVFTATSRVLRRLREEARGLLD